MHLLIVCASLSTWGFSYSFSFLAGQDSVDFLRVDAKRSDRTLAFLEKNREEKINRIYFKKDIIFFYFFVEYQEGKKELIKAKAMSEKHRLQLLEKEREFNETEAYGKEISDKIKTMINDGTVNPKVAYRGIGRGLFCEFFLLANLRVVYRWTHEESDFQLVIDISFLFF